jgi:Ca2+-binding RTX toxin-like protein
MVMSGKSQRRCQRPETLEPRKLFTAALASVDAYAVNEDASLVVSDPADGVLANDVDPDGDAITATLATPPAHGELSLSSDGTFSYTPDSDYSGPDGFSYVVDDGTGGTPSTETGVLIDVNPVVDSGKFAFSASEFFADEQAGTALLTVIRTGGDEGTVTVAYATNAGTATEADDFSSDSGVLTFTPGEVAKDIRVAVIADAQAELSETFAVTLSDPTGGATFAGGATPEATVTIVNDDAPPSIVVADAVPVADGDAGQVSFLTFNLALSEPSPDPVSVRYFFGAGSAAAGEDFDDSAGVVTFAPGQKTAAITVPVVGDDVNESEESLSVNLFGATNALLADSIAFGTIVGDDNVAPTAAERTVTRAPGSGAVQIDIGSALSSPDGDALELEIALEPTAGTLAVDDRGTPGDASDDVATYTPAGAGLCGDDFFMYRVTDPFGGTAVGTVSIQTRGVGVLPNASDPQKTDVFVSGTPGDDEIRLTRTKVRGEVRVTINGVDEGVFAATGRIVVAGGDGDDVLDARGLMSGVELFGDAGNDTLKGSRGEDLLYGGDGDDALRGGERRDVLVGGLGADNLAGGDGDDLLVAGATPTDGNTPAAPQSRAALLAAWTSPGDLATRVAAISTGVAGVFLSAGNVHGDDTADGLTGGDGADWLFATSNGDAVRDRFRAEPGEDVLTDID